MDNAQQAGRGEGVEWRGQEWSGGDGSGVEGRGGEGRGGQGRAGQGRVPDCLGGLSRVGFHPAQHARGTGSHLVIIKEETCVFTIGPIIS